MAKFSEKIKSSSYSEKEMADAFEQFMRDHRGLPKVGRFTRIFREIDCQQGRPDFIALAGRKPSFLKGQPISVKLAASLVLSLLHEEAPRTEPYLARSTGLTARSVCTALEQLGAQRYVKRLKTGAYVINSARCLRRPEVVAIELKLKNARRAVFQAQQACAYAQRVLIVVPTSHVGAYKNYETALGRWGIGLATFDVNESKFDMVRMPRLNEPRSRQHRSYAMLQLLEDDSA